MAAALEAPYPGDMSGAVPLLFDRALVRRRLARAFAGRYPDFLIGRAAAELAERLSLVTRRFRRAVEIGSPTGHAAAILRADPRIDATVRVAPLGAADPDVVGDEEFLPLAPESFDLAVSLLSLQAVNDLPGVLAQIRRCLRTDGLLLACVLGGETLRETRLCFAEAESDLTGGASPRVAPFADVGALGGLLQRAGFALPVTDVDRATVRYRTPFDLFADLRALGWTNALHERSRTPLRRSILLRAAELYAARFSDPDGRVRATFDLVWISGWTPHESQQKPLQPGSARTRLADALGTAELGPAIGRGERP